MHDIICPHCSTAFKIDEAGYADILKQVRDESFEQQLHERLALAEKNKRNAVQQAPASDGCSVPNADARASRPPRRRPRQPATAGESSLGGACGNH
jgi:hypothetical protein